MAAKQKYDVIKPPRERNIPFVLQKWREAVTKRPVVFDNQVETQWDPTWAAQEPMNFKSVTVNAAWFCVLGDLVWYMIEATGRTVGSASQFIYATLPVPAYDTNADVWQSIGYIDGGSARVGSGWVDGQLGQLVFSPADGSNWTIGTGKYVYGSGWYRREKT